MAASDRLSVTRRVAVSCVSVGRKTVWLLSAGVVGLVATVATIRLGLLAMAAMKAPGTVNGVPGISFTVVYLVGAALVLVLAFRLERSVAMPNWAYALGAVALAVIVRAGLAAAYDAPLGGENGVIHNQAVAVLEGANCCFSHRPMGYPLVLAAAYRSFGVGSHAIEILNIALAACTAWLVFDIGRTAWNRQVGVVAAVLYAVVPSQVLMSLPPLTEPLYTTAIALLTRVVLLPARTWLAAAAAGCVIALAQYVRATAAPLLLPVVLLPGFAGAPLRRWIAYAVATVLAFLVLMAPVTIFNFRTHGELSVSTSAYGGWSLFVGANSTTAGRFNAEDSVTFAGLPGDSAWDRSEIAGELGIRRIMADPAAYVAMQPRKFSVLWADESYASLYAFAPAGATTPPEANVSSLLSQLFYVPILMLALLGICIEGHRGRPVVLLIGMVVSLVSLTHAFLEVHGRYHAYLVPLLIVLAAAGLAQLTRWRSRRT